jgi:hypothetical protein
MTTAIQLLESLLMNLPCTEVEKAGHLWQLRFGDGVATLNIECPWRLLSQGAVAHGGDDDGQPFGLSEPIDGVKKTTRLLAASPVVSLNVREICSDLSLTFENGVVLEAFNGSSGYEGWTCSGTDGTVVAQGGGTLSVWKPNH